MDYARALVEHPGWRWEPGMVTDSGALYLARRGELTSYVYHVDPEADDGVGSRDWQAATPDINHPATKGWLLHMLREATGTQDVEAQILSSGMWRAVCEGRSPLPNEATEGEALAAALLAVWGGA